MQKVLEEASQQPVRVLVVWQPILVTDWSRPGAGALRRIGDTRARQFWDKGNLFSSKLGQKLNSDAAHPQPACCWADDLPWDLVALYPPGASWEDALPVASYIDGPVWQVKAELAEALSKHASEETPEKRKP